MDKGLTSKEKIIAAATTLFHSKGYSATGLNEILQESGAPRGSLYYYFPGGKEALAVESLRSLSETIQSRLRDELARHDDPVDAVQHHIDCIIDGRKTRGGSSFTIGLLALETQLSSEALRGACREAFEAIRVQFSKKLADSGLSSDLAESLGIAVLSMIQGAIVVSAARRDHTYLETARRQIGDLLNLHLVEARKRAQGE